MEKFKPIVVRGRAEIIVEWQNAFREFLNLKNEPLEGLYLDLKKPLNSSITITNSSLKTHWENFIYHHQRRNRIEPKRNSHEFFNGASTPIPLEGPSVLKMIV